MTQPTDQQIQRLHEALLSALLFDDLRLLTRTRLEADLEQIIPVQGRNLTHMAYDLIRVFAARAGGLAKLIHAAGDFAPDNPLVRAMVAELGGIDFEVLPLPEEFKHPTLSEEKSNVRRYEGSDEPLFVIKMTKPQFERMLRIFIDSVRSERISCDAVLSPSVLLNQPVLRRRRSGSQEGEIVTNIAEADTIELTNDSYQGIVLELTEKEVGLWIVVTSKGYYKESVVTIKDNIFCHGGYLHRSINSEAKSKLLTWLEGLA